MAPEAGVAEEELASGSEGAPGDVALGGVAPVGVAPVEVPPAGESVVEKGDRPSVGVLGTLPTTCVPIRTVSLISSARAAPEVRSHTAPLWP